MIDDLIEQTTGMADIYLEHAIQDIDKRLGEGYAKQHPELIGAYMRTAMADCSCIVISRSLEEGMTGFERAIDQLGKAIEYSLANHGKDIKSGLADT